MATVGILAYGSLIHSPGEEIETARIRTIDEVWTPFNIEFARSSRTRGGAPTLVPVSEGGAEVKGKVFELGLSEKDAMDVLYRRETNKVKSDQSYKRPKEVGSNSVLVEQIEGFAGLDIVFYTKISATIDPLTAERLAEFAIKSVEKSDPGRDGISYLIDAKKNGLVTGLSREYEAEILKQTHCESLVMAREKMIDIKAENSTF